MPIFHDIVERPPSQPRRPLAVDDDNHLSLFQMETSWTDRRDNHTSSSPRANVPAVERVVGVGPDGEGRPLNREELIERIKRGTSPTWPYKGGIARESKDRVLSPKDTSPQRYLPSTLLPAIELEESSRSGTGENVWSNKDAGMEIERPKSALHSGDFRDDKNVSRRAERESMPMSTSPVAPWHADFPTFLATRTPSERRAQAISYTSTTSSLSQFVLMPPTSPLVQSTYNSDLEDPPSNPMSQRRAHSPIRDNRRHTFSPRSLQAYGSAISGSSPPKPRPIIPTKRESMFPYQAHQPRRSITSLAQLSHSIPSSTPQTPLIRPRGLSNASESSPLHHAPMVGSYEESILRGRMSTIPSRPLNFVAQIGVLGKGKCKSSLRCPPHATVPFPAVFYSYGSGAGGRIMDNQPSPYVGLIDIENNISLSKSARDESRRRKRYASPAPSSDRDEPGPRQQAGSESTNLTRRLKREKLRKRSQSPKAPPGGSYRIPQQGQLQIIIKNPNKTAVKLFLVPYDLSDMEPGQKTFIRQRSYSAGPIIDMPLSARSNLGTDRPEAALSNADDPRDRPVLRYLIHLHICCTAKGRYYLYKSIRVVFANRVPDGKEKLRNEIQLPEPKYSVYKPSRDSIPGHQHSASCALGSAKVTADDRTTQRGSTSMGVSQNTYLDATNVLDWSLPKHNQYVKPIPFILHHLETVPSRPVSRDTSSVESNAFAKHTLSESPTNMTSDLSKSMMGDSLGEFTTSSGRNDPNTAWAERRPNPFLTESSSRNGDAQFCLGRSASPNSHDSTNKQSEGLLARQLRSLSVERA
ncbi:uncharacterized protein PV09_09446 [Verruconis gallopava]|uniref:Atos-like conserved domain-containing protein n=1 Tax=Verruconis gallopava TaxID=253628 RepID=A0A0D1ZXI8_9PEZI|nr:uncharacterized protein PV09_09446 [Verruconis gallopava]KIV98794.1 hypothetical protein PV09_09446 [Verruconis gallopava]